MSTDDTPDPTNEEGADPAAADATEPTAVAATPPSTGSTEAPLREELEYLGVPAPVIPARTADEFDIDEGRAWAPDRDISDIIRVPRSAVPTDVDAYVPDAGALHDKLATGDGESEMLIARVDVSHSRDPLGPTVDLTFGDSVETVTDAVTVFWTAVHWARANGIPGVGKEQLGFQGAHFRLGGLYLYAGFELLPRESDYAEYGERFVDDESLLPQFRPEGLASIEEVRDVEPESVKEIDGAQSRRRGQSRQTPDEPSHASAILSRISADEEEEP